MLSHHAVFDFEDLDVGAFIPFIKSAADREKELDTFFDDISDEEHVTIEKKENPSTAPRRSRWQQLATLSSGSCDVVPTLPELQKPIGFDRCGRPVHGLRTAKPKQPWSYVSDTAQFSGNKSLVAQVQEKEWRLQQQFAAFNVQMPSRWKSKDWEDQYWNGWDASQDWGSQNWNGSDSKDWDLKRNDEDEEQKEAQRQFKKLATECKDLEFDFDSDEDIETTDADADVMSDMELCLPETPCDEEDEDALQNSIAVPEEDDEDALQNSNAEPEEGDKNLPDIPKVDARVKALHGPSMLCEPALTDRSGSEQYVEGLQTASINDSDAAPGVDSCNLDAVAKGTAHVEPASPVEAMVTAPLVLVFIRPSMNAAVAGVLKCNDVLITSSTRELSWKGHSCSAAEAGAQESGPQFLCIEAGSWVREARRRDQFFQLTTACWIHHKPSAAGQSVIAQIEMPPEVSHYEVISECVTEHACQSTHAVSTCTWRKGDVIEVTKALCNGWLLIVRKTSHAPNTESSPPTRSSFVPTAAVVRGVELRCRGVHERLPNDDENVRRQLPDAESVETAPPTPASSTSAASSLGVVVHSEMELISTPPAYDDSEASTASSLDAALTSQSALEILRQLRLSGLISDCDTMPARDVQAEEAASSASTEEVTPASQSPDACGTREVDRRTPVSYYGICDLKYDKRRPAGQRLRVLELGNGRLSRFTGYGEVIPRHFKESFRVVKQLDRAAFVDNKKMTHDVFVECGFQHLLPRQVCFPRIYTPSLAKQIEAKLKIPGHREDASVVLKLVNRCRGAGVVVTNFGKDLDDALHRLLEPPADNAWLSEKSLDRVLSSDPNSFEEQQLHWWSNECPVFLAELCEVSHPIEKDGDTYDATMRIGFVLKSGTKDFKKGQCLGVEFLGGYWKLPVAPTSSIDVRARCVSKASSGTAAVSEEELSDVYGELRMVLSAVFAANKSGLASIPRLYSDNSLLFSYVLARHAAAQFQRVGQGRNKLASGAVTRENSQVQKFLNIAEARLMPKHVQNVDVWRRQQTSQDLPIRAVLSYIERQFGVAQAQRGDWEEAVKRFERSLELHRCNASTLYLLGISRLRISDFRRARDCFLRSIRLDPDFKANYINLGVVELSCAEWAAATAVSEAGLRRHPQAFQCSYNLGLAFAHRLLDTLRDMMPFPRQDSQWQLQRQRFSEALQYARRSALRLWQAKDQREQLRTEWSQRDDDLIRVLEAVQSRLGRDVLPEVSSLSVLEWLLSSTQGWTLIHWRP